MECLDGGKMGEKMRESEGKWKGGPRVNGSPLQLLKGVFIVFH